MMRRAGWSGRSGKVAEMFGERGGVGRCWGGGGGDRKADLVPPWHGEEEGRVGELGVVQGGTGSGTAGQQQVLVRKKTIK